jgi:hypothetical protein
VGGRCRRAGLRLIGGGLVLIAIGIAVASGIL